jgi:membrane associated rhomboid family serine protease
MITLYFFGPHLELYVGSTAFVVIYMGSLIAGSLLGVIRHRNDPNYRAVGASGAVSGVIFGFILFQPLAKLRFILFPVGIPAFIFAIGYVVISIYGMRTRMGRVGHDAHLGGALAGVILTIVQFPRALQIFFSNFR